jgi:hypothetical protein
MLNDFLIAEQAYKICLKEKKRIEEFEDFIVKSSYFSHRYARDVLKTRWPKCESVVINNAYTAFWYTSDLIKARWPEAENIIATDNFNSYMYARDILDGPFYKAHTQILNSYWGERYARNIKNKIIEPEFLI